MTDFNGHTSSITNTADGLPSALGLGSSGDTVTTSYAATDAPSSITLGNGSTLQEFAYSDVPSGAVASETDTPSSALSPAAYTYDAQSRVTQMTPGSGSAKSYSDDASSNLTTLPTGASGTYNDAGEMTSSALWGTTTDYTYDASGNRTQESVGGTATVSSTYNGASELTSYDDSAADTSAIYDGNGRRTSATVTPSTPSTISAVGSTASSYADAASTLSVNPQHAGDALVLSTMAYSGSVSITSVSGGGSTWTKVTSSANGGVDKELWLGTVDTTGASTITVTYSSSLGSTWAELDAQEFASSTGTSTTWGTDVTGTTDNTTSSTSMTLPSLTPTSTDELYVGFAQAGETAGSGSTSGFTYFDTAGTNAYVYDPSVTGSVSPTATQSPAGTSSTVAALITATSVPSGGSSVTESFVWSAPSRLLMDSNNAYLYGPSGNPFEQVNLSTGTIMYLIADALDSVRGVVSASGALSASTSYDAWGNPETLGGLTSYTPFGFAGGYTDPSGLIYLVNRYYDPSTGAFVSVDPDIAASQEPYSYAAGDPVNARDPNGDIVTCGGGCPTNTQPSCNTECQFLHACAASPTWCASLSATPTVAVAPSCDTECQFLHACAADLTWCESLSAPAPSPQPASTSSQPVSTYSAVGGEPQPTYYEQNPGAGPPSTEQYFGNGGPGAPTPTQAQQISTFCSAAENAEATGVGVGSVVALGGTAISRDANFFRGPLSDEELDDIGAASVAEGADTAGIGLLVGGAILVAVAAISLTATGIACG